MRYIVLLTAARPDSPPPPELMEAIMKLGGEAGASGTLVDQGGLEPSAAGARVTVAGSELTVTDGPFAEAKEVVSYAIYDVKDKAEVVEWATRFMKVHRDLWPGWEGESQIFKVMGPGGA